MGLPSGSETAPKELSLHPGTSPAATVVVSADSSLDSSTGSDSDSSNASPPKAKKSRKSKKSRDAKADLVSSSESSSSGDSSGSDSSDNSGSSTSSEPPSSFQTPVAVIQPASNQSIPNASGQPTASDSHQPNHTPIGPTPVKSLVPHATPVVVPSTPVTVSAPSAVAASVAPTVAPAAALDPSRNQEAQSDPAPAVARSVPVVETQPVNNEVTGQALVEIEYDQVELLESLQAAVPETVEASTGQGKQKSRKVSKAVKATDAYKDERYRLKALKLERNIRRAEEGKKKKSAKKEKGGKQSKGPPKKRKKKKSASPPSSDDDSSDSSSESSLSSSSSDSDPAPLPLGRIPKISQGRALQQCAMSRVKESGFVKDLELKLIEISDALAALDALDLIINPDLAYCFFHQVPGTGLPHMLPHIQSFGERYGILVKSVVKFHLTQMLRVLNEKKLLVVADQDTQFSIWWQFQNDLARAPSTSTYVVPPDISQTPLRTPALKRPRSALYSKHKKSRSKSAKKSKSKSRKRSSNGKNKKSGRKGKKSKKSKKKKKKEQAASSSEV